MANNTKRRLLSKVELDQQRVEMITEFIKEGTTWNKNELDILFNNLVYEYNITKEDFDKAIVESNYITNKSPKTKLDSIFKGYTYCPDFYSHVKNHLENDKNLIKEGLTEEFIESIDELRRLKQAIIWRADNEKQVNDKIWKATIVELQDKIQNNWSTYTRVRELVEDLKLY